MLQSSQPHIDPIHAHIMLTMRELVVDADGIANFGKKKRNKDKEYYDRDQTYQSWDDRKLIAEQRQNWEILANQYLAKTGHDVKIDCRSLEDQGVERIPQIHLGPKVIAMQKRGIRTERGDEYFLIDLANAAQESEQKEREAERTKTALVNANREAERISQLEIVVENEPKPQSPSPRPSRPQPKTNRGRRR